MAIQNARILIRRGDEADFNATNMQPGEWALSTDEKIVRICVAPGVCIRMATYDAFEADMAKIEAILTECQTIEESVNRIYEELKGVVVDVERVEAAAQTATEKAEESSENAKNAYDYSVVAQNKANEASESTTIASTKALEATEASENSILKASEAFESAERSAISSENSESYAEISKSYAVGGTGERLGEDTDNSKYYSEQAKQDALRAEEAAEKAESVADIGIMTVDKAGIGKPDGTTITVDADGTMHSVGGGGTAGTANYLDLQNKPSINGVELSGNKTLSSLGIQPAGNYLTEETDPTVPEWAKTPEKPSYTADEVGADKSGSASTALADAKAYTNQSIANLVDGAPETLNTLKEISDALSESEEAVEAINQAIGNKLDKNGDSKDNTVIFTQASTRENIASTEKHSTLFGKIAKWFADLKTVAFSGSYNDLSNKPTIPTVNNATFTIQKNGSNVQTFTANASSNKTANIIVPTKTSELENDSGFLSSATALDTYEEIMANTKSGKFAGAKGVKEGFSKINNSLGGMSFYEDEDGNKYVVGADSVPKKLGSGEATINSVNQSSYTIEEDGKYIVTAIGNASKKPIIYINNVQQTPISEIFQSSFSTYVSMYELELKKSDVVRTQWYLLHVIRI